MFKNVYDYIFYKLYRWSIKLYGDDYYNVIHTTFMLSTAIVFNLMTILALIYMVTGYMIESDVAPKQYWVISVILIAATNYIYFKYNGRYKKILKKYEKEDERERRRGNMFVAVYCVSSLILLILSGFVSSYVNH